MIDRNFWKEKRVFITGHTGFKGSWLSIWLSQLGAKITGYALDPPTSPNLFDLAEVKACFEKHIVDDIRNADRLKHAINDAHPEIVIHMAAQPLVRESYKNPTETYAINVMGTINMLEAVRCSKNVKAVINVTTDKCYENKEWVWGYRENEPMGGYDPYSNSKACSELVTFAYRQSFFNPNNYPGHGVALASARAGNVIGGGDWAGDRLIPDCVKSLLENKPIIIRNPQSIRPWQHVLEPLSGYLMLAERLFSEGPNFAEGWNFGPDDSDTKPVKWIVEKVCEKWGKNATYIIDEGLHPHEAHYLKLDCSKARQRLGWMPKWTLDQTLDYIIEWVCAYKNNESLRLLCQAQIESYLS
jgi:CDP-glucose 4,6-dehydratase